MRDEQPLLELTAEDVRDLLSGITTLNAEIATLKAEKAELIDALDRACDADVWTSYKQRWCQEREELLSILRKYSSTEGR